MAHPTNGSRNGTTPQVFEVTEQPRAYDVASVVKRAYKKASVQLGLKRAGRKAGEHRLTWFAKHKTKRGERPAAQNVLAPDAQIVRSLDVTGACAEASAMVELDLGRSPGKVTVGEAEGGAPGVAFPR